MERLRGMMIPSLCPFLSGLPKARFRKEGAEAPLATPVVVVALSATADLLTVGNVTTMGAGNMLPGGVCRILHSRSAPGLNSGLSLGLKTAFYI